MEAPTAPEAPQSPVTAAPVAETPAAPIVEAVSPTVMPTDQRPGGLKAWARRTLGLGGLLHSQPVKEYAVSAAKAVGAVGVGIAAGEMIAQAVSQPPNVDLGPKITISEPVPVQNSQIAPGVTHENNTFTVDASKITPSQPETHSATQDNHGLGTLKIQRDSIDPMKFAIPEIPGKQKEIYLVRDANGDYIPDPNGNFHAEKRNFLPAHPNVTDPSKSILVLRKGKPSTVDGQEIDIMLSKLSPDLLLVPIAGYAVNPINTIENPRALNINNEPREPWYYFANSEGQPVEPLTRQPIQDPKDTYFIHSNQTATPLPINPPTTPVAVSH